LRPTAAIDEYLHTDLVQAALAIAVAMRGELAEQVILHDDRLNPASTPRRSSRGSPARTTWSAQLAARRYAGTTLGPNHSGPH